MAQEGQWDGIRPRQAPPEGLYCSWTVPFIPCYPQELRPRGLDVKQEELGDLVDKEMAATAAAIETASARIEVRVTMRREVATGTVLGPAETTGEARGALGSAQPLPSTRRC